MRCINSELPGGGEGRGRERGRVEGCFFLERTR